MKTVLWIIIVISELEYLYKPSIGLVEVKN